MSEVMGALAGQICSRSSKEAGGSNEPTASVIGAFDPQVIGATRLGEPIVTSFQSFMYI
ncbi:MAG: hypothetical protein U5L03_12505 [Burkholderiaceae bacterium]|nr:hypothetical protein [Burkholderiaceae bacterium]